MTMVSDECELIAAVEKVFPIGHQRSNTSPKTESSIVSTFGAYQKWRADLLTASVNGHKQKDIEQRIQWNFSG